MASMLLKVLTVVVPLVLGGVLVYCGVTGNLTDLVIIGRDEWGARPAKAVENMTNPVPYVIIHHSYKPEACRSKEECIKAMQSMQIFHQDDRGWNDIGYSFGVGGDARTYVGRGWSAVGAHAPKYNNKSIGICVIGDWTSELPPHKQLFAVRQLIEYGVKIGKIAPDYKLFGHRQVRETECPGDVLFTEISTWEHFSNLPPLFYREKNDTVIHKS